MSDLPIPHSVRQPTEDNLKADAISIAGQIEGLWEGEVECIVVLVPRAGLRMQWATTVRDRPKYLEMLRVVRSAEQRVVQPAGQT